MPAWNSNPAAFQPKASTVLPTADALRTVIRLVIVALAAAVAYHYSSFLLAPFPLQARTWIGLLLLGVSGASTTAAINTAYTWQTTRSYQAAQQTLFDRQRKLLGLAPPPPKPPPPPSSLRKPSLPTGVSSSAPTTPITAPLRALSRTPQQPPADVPYTPPPSGVPGSTGLSRAAAVATPQQLQPYLDNIGAASAGRSGAMGTGAMGGAAAGGTFGMGTPNSAYGVPEPGSAGPGQRVSAPFFSGYDGVGGDDTLGQGGDQADTVPSPAMPFGVELPKYRPSWLPRAKAPQPSAAQDMLEAITEEEAEEFLWAVVKVRRQWLEIWTERLREWFALRVLKPLVSTTETAHTTPNAILAKYGHPTRLPPLPSVFTGGDAVGLGAGTGGGGLVPGAGPELDALVRNGQHAVAMMQQLPNTPANAPLLKDGVLLAEALTRYEQLLLLLRGRRPSELLPPSPPGYLWSRIQGLSKGTCVPEYNWNGGGPWAGRAWSPDLPTDSQLLLYLFAAFLDAPGWEFGACSVGGAGGGGAVGGVAGAWGGGVPLFLGAVRAARAPTSYSAILAYRPEKPSRGVDAVLALSQAGGGGAGAGGGGGMAGGAGLMLGAPGASTVFAFLAEGRTLALTGYNALFHSLLAFLAYHKAKYNGAVGAHSLQDASLGLADVIDPPRPGAEVVASHQVFGWWFPPRLRGSGRDKSD